MRIVSALLLFASAPAAGDVAFTVKSNLRVGVEKVDITPPAGTQTRGHTRDTIGIRDPMRAGVLVMDDGATRAAIVTMDLLFAPAQSTGAIRQAVAAAAGVPEGNILVAASHNHSGPSLVPENDWSRQVYAKIGGAAGAAARSLRVVSIGYGEDRISFNVNRRFITPQGVSVGSPNPDGPADRRVKVLRFDDGSSLEPIAVLMHAACHATGFTKSFPHMSSDFPGEAQRFVERVYAGRTRALFLQGCTGDVRPNLPGPDGKGFRSADEADMRWMGADLGGAVVRASARAAVREEIARRPSEYRIRSASASVELPGKKEPVQAALQALRIGDFVFVTIPGEPFTEYGFNVEKAIGARARTIVVGYANDTIGYISTEAAYRYAGYEPTSSRLKPEAERTLLKALVEVAGRTLQ